MSVWMKILLVLFPIIVYTILRGIFFILDLRRFTKIKVMDIWTLFLIWGIVTFTQNATGRPILAYYLLIAASMGLIMLLLHLFYFKNFSFPKFFKLYWRAVFLVTLAMYLQMIIAAILF